MKFDKFPIENEMHIEEEAKKNIERLTADSREQQEKLRKLANIENHHGAGYQVKNGMFTGGVVGLFVCFGVCVVDLVALDMDTPILEIVSLLICIVLGGLFRAFGLKSHKSKAAVYEGQLQEEVERFQKDLDTINNDAKLRCDSYREAFESAVQDASTYFINSPITNEITEFLWVYLKKELEDADRNPSWESICVKFDFSTSADAVWTVIKEKYSEGKILTGYKQDKIAKYDFFEHRVESLSLERMTALAKALETSLQLRGMTEYAAYTSDTQPHISVNSSMSFHSGKNIVESSVTYYATNSNYQKTRSW